MLMLIEPRADAKSVESADAVAPAAKTHRYHVVLNSHAWTAARLSTEVLATMAVERGLEFRLDDRDDVPMAVRMQEAAASDADIIVAAGGDGTATAAAEALRGTDKILAILPLGTANLLARDLGLPLAPDAWLDALPAMEPRRIDAGDVNGRLFLHKVVIGTVLETAVAREEIRERTDPGAAVEFVAKFVARLSYAGRFAVEIAPKDGERRVEIVEALAVANNDYDEGLGRFFSRQRLDRGTLTLYVLHHLRLFHALRLAAEMFIGRWRQDRVIDIQHVEAVTIRTRRRRIKAMVDGEVGVLPTPLKFQILPGAITVLAPPVTDQPADPES
jgi:diacylglycerol kinase family enzyme